MRDFPQALLRKPTLQSFSIVLIGKNSSATTKPTYADNYPGKGRKSQEIVDRIRSLQDIQRLDKERGYSVCVYLRVYRSCISARAVALLGDLAMRRLKHPQRVHSPCSCPHLEDHLRFIYSSHFSQSHVPEGFNIRGFLALPSHFRCSLEILRKADKEGPYRTSTCLPVAIVRLD